MCVLTCTVTYGNAYIYVDNGWVRLGMCGRLTCIDVEVCCGEASASAGLASKIKTFDSFEVR